MIEMSCVNTEYSVIKYKYLLYTIERGYIFQCK